MKTILISLLLAMTASAVTAQRAIPQHIDTDQSALASSNGDDTFLYFDYAEKICFIDFEQIDVNLREIVVYSKTGEVLLRRDVSSQPVNAIYEIDMSSFKKGSYRLEMNSYLRSIRKEFKI